MRLNVSVFVVLAVTATLAACGPTAEEQRAMDQGQCSGFGFAPGTDAFAHCMMSVSQQRQAQQAANARAQAAQDAADRRAQAARDAADQDAWDKRTGQGKYSNGGSDTSTPSLGMPDLSGMNCTSSSTTTGTENNSTTSTHTSCHN